MTYHPHISYHILYFVISLSLIHTNTRIRDGLDTIPWRIVYKPPGGWRSSRYRSRGLETVLRPNDEEEEEECLICGRLHYDDY